VFESQEDFVDFKIIIIIINICPSHSLLLSLNAWVGVFSGLSHLVSHAATHISGL